MAVREKDEEGTRKLPVILWREKEEEGTRKLPVILWHKSRNIYLIHLVYKTQTICQIQLSKMY